MKHPQAQALGYAIAKKIHDDLRGRKGLSHAWDQIEPEIKSEIAMEWVKLATDVLLPVEVIRS